MIRGFISDNPMACLLILTSNANESEIWNVIGQGPTTSARSSKPVQKSVKRSVSGEESSSAYEAEKRAECKDAKELRSSCNHEGEAFPNGAKHILC